MPLPLLQTKLYIPPSRQHLVARPDLTAKLNAAALQPITLLVAPAGFGKTTVVSEWVAQATPTVAWLSLDDDDNDSTRFLTYLIAALQTCQPAIGANAQGLLATPQALPPKAILTLLLNDLGALTSPLALVLDDYHSITTVAIHEALAFFIEHRPPTVRLLITTRIDPPLPLARWRARHQLVEIRALDLRFRQEEATTFLNEVMGLALTPAEIATLETRTEGWIAGLQLAALSMQGRQDVAGFIRAFSGSHRHVLSYLVEEVLNHCSARILDFLLQTSILERLSAPLCDAVTGRHGSQQLLATIEQANLFLIPLDDEGEWFRYHHLFAEVLRTRLYETQADAVTQLQQRASAWYAQEEFWSEAIHYALAAKDFGQAAHLIEEVGIASFAQTKIQHALKRWLATLPVTLIRTRPRLCLIYVWILFAHLELTTAAQWVAEAEGALADKPDPPVDASITRRIAGEIAAMRSILAAYTFSQPASTALTWSQQALAELSSEQANFRCIAALAQGMAYMRQGAVTEAEQSLAEANRMGRKADNLYLLAVAAAHQIAMQRAGGSLRQALATCRETLSWVAQREAQVYPNFGGLYLNLADLLREQNELDAALEYANLAVTHSDQEVNPSLFIITRLVLLRVQQARGNWAAVWALWADISRLVEQHPNVVQPTLLLSIQAQFHLAETLVANPESNATTATLAGAVAWAQSVAWEEGELVEAHRFLDFIYLYEHGRIARPQILIAWARTTGDAQFLPETLAYLQRQEQIARAGNLLWFQVKIQLLQALAHHIRGADQSTRAALTQALYLTQPENYQRVFLDEGEPLRLLLAEFKAWLVHQPPTEQNAPLALYLDQLLASFDNEPQFADTASPSEPTKIQNQPVPSPNLADPLSDREVEVLQLVAAGLSNSAIAERLIISMSTVKTHINRIFSKLAVQSRTQALVCARELGLLDG